MELVDCLGNPRPEKKITIPELTGDDGQPAEVRVRLLPVRQQVEYEQLQGDGKLADALLLGVLHCCYKADGTRMLTEKNKGEIEALPAIVVTAILTALGVLKDKASDMKAVKKKSRPARRSKSASNSPRK